MEFRCEAGCKGSSRILGHTLETEEAEAIGNERMEANEREQKKAMKKKRKKKMEKKRCGSLISLCVCGFWSKSFQTKGEHNKLEKREREGAMQASRQKIF